VLAREEAIVAEPGEGVGRAAAEDDVAADLEDLAALLSPVTRSCSPAIAGDLRWLAPEDLLCLIEPFGLDMKQPLGVPVIDLEEVSAVGQLGLIDLACADDLF
jgi:hypothetical protein